MQRGSHQRGAHALAQRGDGVQRARGGFPQHADGVAQRLELVQEAFNRFPFVQCGGSKLCQGRQVFFAQRSGSLVRRALIPCHCFGCAI
jgi:hypothetical protein